MSEDTIVFNFDNSEKVFVKHKPGDPGRVTGRIIEHDLAYITTGVRGVRFKFTTECHERIGMQNNSIDVRVMGNEVYFHMKPGRDGDIFRGKSSSKKKGREEKIPKLPELLKKHNILNTHYKLESVGEHAGTPVYKLVPCGDEAEVVVDPPKEGADEPAAQVTTPPEEGNVATDVLDSPSEDQPSEAREPEPELATEGNSSSTTIENEEL